MSATASGEAYTGALFCRGCGKQLTDEERATPGTVFCGECAVKEGAQQSSAGSAAGASGFSGASYSRSSFATADFGAPAGGPAPSGFGSQPGQPVPGLAFALGLIPGVGAIYNAQYVKGLVHALTFGLLAAASDGPGGEMAGFLMAAFLFYMAFEAYHTAQKRLLGQPVDEFSSIVPSKGAGVPIAPVLLIVLGLLVLANNFDLFRFDWLRKMWPVGLIVLGIYLLYERLREGSDMVGGKPLATPGTEGSDESNHAV
jgi:hypothetical protein